MRIIKHELLKLLKYPLMWGILVLFVAFNIFIIWNDVGNGYMQTELKGMYNFMIKGKNESTYAENYNAYAEGVSNEYDTLDMQEIKKMKEKMANFEPSGSYKRFIDGNYDKLQKRVGQIKSNGDDRGDFYPGDIYGIHKKMYALVKRCVIEMLIMMCFSVLYLMDYDRINRTEDLTLSSKIGRGIMRKKHSAGIISGLVFSVLILIISLGVFFAFVPMKGLWKTPVSSVMVMEASGLWRYPFITFVRLNIRQELLLNLLTAIILTAFCGILAGGVQLFVNNSYITMICAGAGFIGLIAAAFAVKQADWLKTFACLNPAVLWRYCGRWFIENDFLVSFAWSEFYTIGIWSIFAIFLTIAGAHYYKIKDI